MFVCSGTQNIRNPSFRSELTSNERRHLAGLGSAASIGFEPDQLRYPVFKTGRRPIHLLLAIIGDNDEL